LLQLWQQLLVASVAQISLRQPEMKAFAIFFLDRQMSIQDIGLEHVPFRMAVTP
jgi:hypothetical protein